MNAQGHSARLHALAAALCALLLLVALCLMDATHAPWWALLGVQGALLVATASAGMWLDRSRGERREAGGERRERTGSRRTRGMAEQQSEQEQCWRVVVHERNAGGWWTLTPGRYITAEDAEQAAALMMSPFYSERRLSNVGVYPEVDGQVKVPGWIKVREGEQA